MTAKGLPTSGVLVFGVAISFLLLIAGLIAHYTGSIDAGTRLLQSGLAVLLATPFARIVVLMFEFTRGREYAFVMMGIGVLLLLGVSIWIGLT